MPSALASYLFVHSVDSVEILAVAKFDPAGIVVVDSQQLAAAFLDTEDMAVEIAALARTLVSVHSTFPVFPAGELAFGGAESFVEGKEYIPEDIVLALLACFLA